MNNEIIKIFNYMASKLGITIDWSQENIYPMLEDIWEKFIQYELIKNIVNFIGFLLLFCITIIFFYELSLATKEFKNNKIVDEIFFTNKVYNFLDSTTVTVPKKSFYTYIGIVLASIFLLLSVVVLPTIFINIIELCIVPEKYILTMFDLL